jgi:uncharacterized protein related to proFAR isomerase
MLIPVVDIMAGVVVHAVRGQRDSYRPVQSALCTGSEPATVARALLAQAGGHCLYVADLDAITTGRAQVGVLRALLQLRCNAGVAVQLWLDAGFTGEQGVWALCEQLGLHHTDLGQRLVPVFGSESLRVLSALAAVPGCALSLDRREGQRMDIAGCWDAPQLWPQRVIVMTLEQVGANAGPDLDTLRQVRLCRPEAWLVGAGGVRHAQDLMAARAAGAQAWLVASALHSGRL